MSRCNICNWSPTTSVIDASHKRLIWDKKDKKFLCTSCITAWVMALLEFDLGKDEEKEKEKEKT